ncbi:MAG: 3-methyl-2-oxobutanoate hydroxymethyltransferase [Chloroflexota bacterium]
MKLTVKDLFELKGKRKLAQVNIRSPKEAAACEAAGVDMIITWERSDIAAVRAAAPDTFLTIGLVWGEYASVTEAMRGAYRAMRLGADAIYCPQSLEYVKAMSQEAIPVAGHVGFVPYKKTWFGGFKATGKTAEDAMKIYDLSMSYQDAGAIGIEMELVPAKIAAEITKRLKILTIGMGAGPDTDAQYLFATDILGDNINHIPRHAKVYRDHKSEYERLHQDAIAAFREFQTEVADGGYPESGHALKVKDDEYTKFMEALEQKS